LPQDAETDTEKVLTATEILKHSRLAFAEKEFYGQEVDKEGMS
jgi:hypothetical protein